MRRRPIFEHATRGELLLPGVVCPQELRNGYGIVELNRAFGYGVPYSWEDRGPDNLVGNRRRPDGPAQRTARPGFSRIASYVNPEAYGLPAPDGNYDTVEVALNRLGVADRSMF